MRRSALRLYAPFIALALVQAAFVVFAPSKGESNNPLASVQAGGFQGAQGGTSGSGGSSGGFTTGAAGSTSGATGGTGATGGGTATGGTSTAAGGAATGGDAGGAAAGDTSHCKGDRQTDIIYNSPPCVPKFAGDNGGATYQGVSDKEIKFVDFTCQPNEQVNAILATQGLAASQEETKAMMDVVARWMSKTYEFYGRTLKWEYVVGDCPTTPPDPAKARQAAAEVAKTHPFAVLVGGGGSAAADVFAQNGILALGVPWNGQEFYSARRPFRWDIFPNGTESVDWFAEYYCKKLAGKPAVNSGPEAIHPQIGPRGTKRKLGIIVPDDGTGTSVPAAKKVQQLVKECSGTDTPLFTYQSDINRAAEQTNATVAGLINAKVTSVVCMCDPIAPVFLTKGLTQNNYYPEHVLAGLGLLDYDVLGRLYEPTQWVHAFGPSQLAQPVPFEQSDVSKIWRVAGNEGAPCNGCNLLTGYMTNLGAMIQMAGPNLNPLSVEQALVGSQYHRGGWNETGGKPDIYLIKYGQGDYNAISDFREVYWSPTATSTIDNKQGAYLPVNNGRRYAGGELDGTFNVPPSAN